MPTYDIVEEGVDKTGDTAIDAVLDDLVGSNTRINFPPGTYKLNGLTVLSGIDDLELVAPNGARLVPGRSGDNVRWFDVSSNGFVLDGFELDMRDTAVPPLVRMNSDSGNWELRRLITRGKVRAATDVNVGSNDSSEARTYFRLSAADGTRGLIQDCYFHEGTCEPEEASNRRAVLVESGNGDLVFNRCWFELWGENTIYAKKPAGAVKIYNCFVRNTQNGIRLGGNSEVTNCVSIKNAKHPRQAWSNGSLQRGVNIEAVDPTDSSRGIDSYNGTLTITESDFYHRYSDSSCGGPITGPVPCQNIVVKNTRISYQSTKNHDAIYTREGRMEDGTAVNLEYLQLENVQVINDNTLRYAISIGQAPDTWGPVSGVLGGSGPQTDSTYISNRMTINGDPDEPDTTPPLADPPTLGKIPIQSAQLVRIDNSTSGSASTYEITAGATVLPAGNDGATVTTSWGPNGGPRRPPNADVATGTAPAGKVYAFYVTGGIVSTEADGPATWFVDGEVYNPGTEGILLTTTITSDKQVNKNDWQQASFVVQPNGAAIAKPLSFNDSQPVHVRLRDLDDDTLEYKLEEWMYLDREHVNEKFHTLSLKPGEQELQPGDGSSYRMKAGTTRANDRFSTVSFEGDFGTEIPVILAQSETFNGPEPIVVRLNNVSSSSFSVRLQEEENRAVTGHPRENVYYISLQQASGKLNNQPFEVQRTETTYTDKWAQISFEQEYESPQFVADIQTFNGPDTANLRYRNLTGTGVEVKIEEEQSADAELWHTTEAIGYTVFEGSE